MIPPSAISSSDVLASVRCQNVEKKTDPHRPSRRRAIFRYWIRLRTRQDESTRDLPLSVIARLHIPRTKHETPRPSEELLQLKDGASILEARSLDDLAAQLRVRYPDDVYERTFHQERDPAAEERWERAMDQLVRLIAEVAVEDMWRKELEGQHVHERSSCK